MQRSLVAHIRFKNPGSERGFGKRKLKEMLEAECQDVVLREEAFPCKPVCSLLELSHQKE